MITYYVAFCIQYRVILFHNIDCRELNEHVNKLRRDTTSKNVEGWTLDVESGSVRGNAGEICGDSWFGYSDDPYEDGSIKTTLNGCGKATLDFGNCWFYNVQALLNGNEIGTATNEELSKKIEFDFNDGDILEIAEFADAVIVFNSFTIVSCC